LTELDTSPPLAAVDLGSNSFHMIVAQFHGEQLRILDRLREPVRLAQGLTDDNRLEEAAAQRALACLEQF
jgi:exopolyphosphatase/guanosine-5'-triphosphate,3'-diphosphate pyrophosphatase